MNQSKVLSSRPKKLLPTKSERLVLNWLKCHTSYLDLGCLINGSPIHLKTNARIEAHFANLRLYDDEECLVPKKNRRTYLPHKLVTRVLREHASGEQTYYFAGSEKPNCRALIMIDVDCHKSGSPEGAMAFVSYLRAHHFANLYYEASTNGRGAHAYFLLEKGGLSVPAIKNVLLKKLQPWLNHLAKGFDLELVEIKGLPPEPLLVVVTLAAVGSWGYWFGWPWLLWHSQQSRFVAAAQQVKVGMSRGAADALADFDGIRQGWFHLQPKHDQEGSLIARHWPNATYCLYTVATAQDSLGCPPGKLLKVELLKLPAGSLSIPDAYDSVLLAFSFLEFFDGDHKNNPGFQYELIYSDPPAKPAAK
jgi:hypothetical protein